MSSTISVSKGVFVFKNNLKRLKERKGTASNINFNVYSEELWYHTYTNLWRNIEKRIDLLNKEMFSSILTDLVQFIKDSYLNKVSEIPTAALLTGINMPDHIAQFTTLMKKITQDVSPHVACIYSQDCQNIKSCIENMINQFINKTVHLRKYESDFAIENKYKLRKTQLNFPILQAWYEKEHDVLNLHKSEKLLRKHQRKVLVVILPDFESFNSKVLQEFILICSSYLNILPFVFVFGIATSLSILHKTLPYHVSSKVNIQYFNSQSSTIYLNNILEDVFLTNDCPFHLGAEVFNLLMDVFLFYDLSVTGFIKKFKYAMLEHFSHGNAMTLCTKKNPTDIISKFDHYDCENVRHLLSFRKLVESESDINKIKLLTDDDYFKSVLNEEIFKLQQYLNRFHLFLKCLKILVVDLPKNPIGKQIRELYSKAVLSDITKSNEYKMCIQLLRFQSKEDLEDKISEIGELIQDACKHGNPNRDMLKEDLKSLNEHLKEIEDSDKCISETDMITEEIGNVNISNTTDRKQFKEMLHKRTQKAKLTSNYELAKEKCLKFIDSLFEKYLYSPNRLYFHEIFFFNDVAIENRIVGSHRAAVHTALNDPHYYLQCKCCEKPNEAVILKSMPDICIIYKLHLEYGKMINLFDWLQAFISIVNPNCSDDVEDEEDNETDPILQARFTLAVAELEFLGFIKSSKRKTDHVQRLTWGG